MWEVLPAGLYPSKRIALRRTVPELRALSKRLGLLGYWRLRKSVQLLSDELSRRALPQLDENFFGTSRRRRSYEVQEVETSCRSSPGLKTYNIPNAHILIPQSSLADVTPVVGAYHKELQEAERSEGKPHASLALKKGQLYCI